MKNIKFEKALPVVLLVLLLVLFIFLANPLNNKNSKEYKEKILIEYGIDYYENFYYDNVIGVKKDKIEYAKSLSKEGIKISVKNIDQVKDEDLSEYFKNCDLNETLAHITPVSPFGKKDYKVSAILSCK